jgi:trehalose 6-phosphate synthase
MVPAMVDGAAAVSPSRPLVMVSNRGPVAFRHAEDGALEARRGAGGLVSGIGPLMAGSGALWVAAAMSDADREAAGSAVADVEGFRFRALDVDPDTYRAYYDEIANTTLWYIHHGLGDRARWPVFDRRWSESWTAYTKVNGAFADLLADVAPEGAVVLVQDLHLSLLAGPLTDARPDLTAVHFSHTPFARPDALAVLDEAVRFQLLEGLAAHRACGFHTRRWEQNFQDCFEAEGWRPPPSFVSPLGPDAGDITAVAAGSAGTEAHAALAEQVGDRRVITRVDRIELSKNIIRGFLAYEELLDEHPGWRGEVVFAALVYPSREGVADYVAYRREVEATIARVNERFGTDDWTPILYDDVDDFPGSVAALRRADVVLVNPVSDGMNLVAKEAALVNDRDGVLVLSWMAGAWDELRDVAVACNPYDISQTATALDRALRMAPEERADRFGRWKDAATARTPADWLADNLAAAD